MAENTSFYASQLRSELVRRNRLYARGRAHVESYGAAPVIVYAPENDRHGNFFDAAYAAIMQRPDWLKRFDKVHAQARRSLPKAERRWRELDSSMSSDALLMNVFCTPGVVESRAVRNALGLDANAIPAFGWRARVPLVNGRFDRTEVDMRLGTLLVEAKLTEGDFQTCFEEVVEAYRDFDEVFDRALLPRVEIVVSRRKEAVEFPEDYTQEYEEPIADPSAALKGHGFSRADRLPENEPALAAEGMPFDEELSQQGLKPQHVYARDAARLKPCPFKDTTSHADTRCGYAGYQLIRNVLAAQADGSSFCVLLDERRPDLRETWFQVMAAVKSSELRVRLKTLTWQELAVLLPEDLQEFLDVKYGIVAPGQIASPIEETGENE